MKRQVLLASIVAVAIAPVAGANLLDTWQEVQESLAAGDADAAERSIQVLQDQAAELEVWRMPAFAAALVSWAETNPGAPGEAMVRAARELDPDYPSSYFLEARWQRGRGATMDAIRSYAAGWKALLFFEPTRRVVTAMFVMWTTFSIAITFLVMMVAVTLRYLRGLAHDARELGGVLFQPANAWVFTFVVLLLPLFAGLGPLWLLVYLFCSTWIYLSVRLRVWAVIACFTLIFLVPVLSWVQNRLLQAPTLADRVEVMLDERTIDYSTLRDVVDLEPTLAEIHPFHMILGELFRMHGEPGLAKIQFQKASAADPEDVRAMVFVANLALEEGDSQRAVQILTSALEIDAQNAYVYHNLSLALDLNRRFEEGDVARIRAREFKGSTSAENGLRGLDPRIRFPRLGAADVAQLETYLDVQARPAGADQPPPMNQPKHLLAPLSLVFAIGIVFGAGMLLIRHRSFRAGKECTKCGKVYRLETGFGESSVFCPQCVSVFHKRDVVSIEQQTSKLRGIRNWERLTVLGRRLGGLLFPGSPYYLSDRLVRGVLFSFVIWFLATGALIWIPTFLPMIEPIADFQPIRIGMVALAGLMVLRSATMNWDGR
jgi:tetratricopeptide (TPR) repeat protein